ncbi:MAG: CDP-glycerol glycerophosphotransferase family protein [Puniceicoccaceae bacterium]
MRVLIFNHFFDQDIQALIKARGAHEVFPIPFQYFRSQAVKVLGREITEGELEAYNDPDKESQRLDWKRKSETIFLKLRAIYRFDIFVAPSDTFFYIRDFIQCCRSSGIPVIILQKETTISPYTMEVHSRRIGKEFPFISDKMLVCSSRQRQFWLNAGAPEDKIVISGQPRFDIYADIPEERDWLGIGLPVDPQSKVILFFSYDLDAYAPKGESTAENATWKHLRDETEAALLELVEKDYTVLVKPHPQQRSRLERKQLAQKAGQHWQKKVFWVDRAVDARDLLRYADVVVGFQTTALYEAMLAGKPVVYTHWTDPVQKYEDKLIPFWKHPGALELASSGKELIRAIASGQLTVSKATMQQRRDLAVEHIGEIDGKATERAWSELEQWVQKSQRNANPSLGSVVATLRCISGYSRYLANLAGLALSPLLFLILASLSRFFPALSKGSTISKEGLKARFAKFAGFWKGYAQESWRSGRNSEK